MRVSSNSSGIVPLWEECLVKPDPAEKVSAGGIIIPNPKDEISHTGVLIACGPLAFRDEDDNFFPWAPDIGEKVSFARYAGTLDKGNDGEDYRSMKDRDIKRVVNPKK